MGDYLEDLLDGNDVELELIASLFDNDRVSDEQYGEWIVDDDLLDDILDDESYL